MKAASDGYEGPWATTDYVPSDGGFRLSLREPTMGIHFVQLEERHRNMIRQLSSRSQPRVKRPSPSRVLGQQPIPILQRLSLVPNGW